MSYPGALPAEIPPLNYDGSPIWSSAFLLTPSFCDCTYHGSCQTVNDSTLTAGTKQICVCDPGWTGLSDIMDARGASCHVNTDVIQWLWVANLILWGLALLNTSPKVYRMLRKHSESKEKMKLKGKPFGIRDNKGLFSVIIALLVCVPGMMLVGVIRIASPLSRVGLDLIISVFWFLGRCGLAASVAVHQPALMRQMLRAQSSADQVVRDYDRYGQFLALLQGLAGAWIIPVLATRGQDLVLTRVCFALFVGQVWFSFVLFNRQARAIKRILFKILTESAQANPTRNLIAVRDRLCANQDAVFRQTLVQTILYFSFTVAPPLWLLYDYMLPISWLTPPLLLVSVVNAITDEASRKDNNTSAGGSTFKKSKTRTAKEGEKPFEGGPEATSRRTEADDKNSESFNQTSMFGSAMVVEVADVEDNMLMATGQQFTKLSVLRSIAGFRPSSVKSTDSKRNSSTPTNGKAASQKAPRTSQMDM